MFFNKKKTSAYSKGVADAKADLRGFKPTKNWSKRQHSDFLHDIADKNQYRIRADRGAKASDYERGKAMEFGMYAHTGKHIK